MNHVFFFIGDISMGATYLENGFIISTHEHGATGTGGPVNLYGQGVFFCDFCAIDVSAAMDFPGILHGAYGDAWMGKIAIHCNFFVEYMFGCVFILSPFSIYFIGATVTAFLQIYLGGDMKDLF